jgi:single-strand DNA-binding protein
MTTATVTLVGNLTRDPEIRYTHDGQATAILGIAVNRRRKDAAREREESTSFFDVVCWRELAENVALSLSKGTRVVVTGRLEQRTWESADGSRRSKVEVVADDLGLSLRFANAEVQRTAPTESPESDPDEETPEPEPAISSQSRRSSRRART